MASFVLVDTTSAQTLENKTLDTPIITDATLTDAEASGDPTTNLGVATKQYVDNAITGTVASYTTTDTLDAGVRLAKLSGATFTLTLPVASLNTDRIVTFLHNGTSLTQVYTLQASGAETIDGTNTYLLYTAGERLTVISDGSNWIMLDHLATLDWVDVGVMTITATSVNPTKPTTPDIDKVYWRREGDQVFLRYILQISSAAGGAAGTGNYLFALPTNIAFNTTILTPVATTLTAALRSEAVSSSLNGTGYTGVDSVSNANCQFFAYDTTHFQVWRLDTFDDPVGSTSTNLATGELYYYFEISARAANWRL